jgi:hypothetical protein
VRHNTCSGEGCPGCDRVGKVPCSKCRGFAELNCPICKATGEVPD